MSLESFVGHCVGYARKGEYDDLQNHLFKHLDALRKNIQLIPAALSHLLGDISLNTMSIAFLGGVLLSHADVHPELTTRMAEALIHRGDVKQLYGRRPVLVYQGIIIRAYANVVANNELTVGRQGLSNLRKMLDPSTISPAHGAFLMVAIKMNHLAAAEDLLSKQLIEVDPYQTGVNHVDVLAYYYYGALAYAGLHRWNQALDFLEACLSVPAYGCSTLMVDAFQLSHLVHLIAKGTVPTAFGSLNGNSDRICRRLSAELLELCQAIEARDFMLASGLLKVHEKALRGSHLWGLILQAVQSIKGQAITHLTRTYVTLTLDDIAAHIGEPVAVAEARLRTMIAAGDIVARINRREGTVSFDDRSSQAPEAATGAATSRDIESRIDKVLKVMQLIQTADDLTVTSEGYTAAKLRGASNLREVIADAEQKRKAQGRSLVSAMSNLLRGPIGF